MMLVLTPSSFIFITIKYFTVRLENCIINVHLGGYQLFPNMNNVIINGLVYSPSA